MSLSISSTGATHTAAEYVPAGVEDPTTGDVNDTASLWLGDGDVAYALDGTPAEILAALDRARAVLLAANPHLTRTPSGPAGTNDGIILPSHSLDQWAGRTLDDDERDVLADALDRASLPDTVATIVGSWDATP